MARSPDLAASIEVIDLAVNGVGVTLMPTASSRAERSPDMRESARFLELAEQKIIYISSYTHEKRTYISCSSYGTTQGSAQTLNATSLMAIRVPFVPDTLVDPTFVDRKSDGRSASKMGLQITL